MLLRHPEKVSQVSALLGGNFSTSVAERGSLYFRQFRKFLYLANVGVLLDSGPMWRCVVRWMFKDVFMSLLDLLTAEGKSSKGQFTQSVCVSSAKTEILYHGSITSTESPSFCTTTFSASLTSLTARPPQSHDYSCYVSRPILTPPPLRLHKNTDLRAHDFAHSAELWRQQRLANITLHLKPETLWNYSFQMGLWKILNSY